MKTLQLNYSPQLIARLGLLVFPFFAFSQTQYEFTNSPVSEGWFYYSDNPNGGFSYSSFTEDLSYSIHEGTATQFYRKLLDTPLSGNYCVQFTITPTNQNNYNTFFPLLLTEFEQQGPHFHPWRENPVNFMAGPHQNLDLIGIEVFGSQVRFVKRNNNNTPSTLIEPLNPAFYMTNGNHYLIQLEVINSINATVSIYGGQNFANLLAQDHYTIPQLAPLTQLYISNGNGNSFTLQEGYVDNYGINYCDLPEIPEDSVITEEEVIVPILELPNVLTVNSDGINDFYELPEKYIENYSVTILNRWGEIIYTSSEKKNWIFWDGKTNYQNSCSEGVYYYLFEAKLINSESITKHGFISLINN